jgi:hypothetical protein
MGTDEHSENKLDKDRYMASMARLEDIYRNISDSAVVVSTWRCPYKDVRDHCTARFGCRNQSFIDGPEKPAMCTGSDNLDYRDAWESTEPPKA